MCCGTRLRRSSAQKRAAARVCRAVVPSTSLQHEPAARWRAGACCGTTAPRWRAGACCGSSLLRGGAQERVAARDCGAVARRSVLRDRIAVARRSRRTRLRRGSAPGFAAAARESGAVARTSELRHDTAAQRRAVMGSAEIAARWRAEAAARDCTRAVARALLHSGACCGTRLRRGGAQALTAARNCGAVGRRGALRHEAAARWRGARQTSACGAKGARCGTGRAAVPKRAALRVPGTVFYRARRGQAGLDLGRGDVSTPARQRRSRRDVATIFLRSLREARGAAC